MDRLSEKSWTGIWLLGLTVILTIHAVWELLDESPAVWDMAYHQLQGWRYLAAWQDGRFFEQFSALSPYYPPLYYLQEAMVLRVFPATQFLAWLANLVGMLLLSFSSYRLAALFMKPAVAVATGWLPLLFPLVVWTSRTSLLDLPLAGWVAASGYLLVKSNFLQDRSWSLGFGLACAAGSLTKWTFGLFLILPMAHVLIYSPHRRKTLLHLAFASCLALPLVLLWYFPNLESLMERFQMTAQAAVREGDPGWDHLLGWIYYPRSLASYYLYFPLTVLGVYGVTIAGRQRQGIHQRLFQFLWWWLLGGLFFMTLLPAKDPRYIMPLACPLAILLVAPWRQRDAWVIGILVLAFLQMLSVSFLIPPLKIVLFEGVQDTDYRSIRQEWVLYQSHYFDIAGPPRREDWGIEKILDAVGTSGRVGFLPDAARFNPVTFELSAVQRKAELEVIFLWVSQPSAESLSELDFVIGKTGSQGLSYMAAWTQPTYRLLDELNWPLVDTWLLPDQSRAQLWRNPLTTETPER
jgi:4-amino-4-deoxy-L-arabinose transferase-like glycosyltransferase